VSPVGRSIFELLEIDLTQLHHRTLIGQVEPLRDLWVTKPRWLQLSQCQCSIRIDARKAIEPPMAIHEQRHAGCQARRPTRCFIPPDRVS